MAISAEKIRELLNKKFPKAGALLVMSISYVGVPGEKKIFFIGANGYYGIRVSLEPISTNSITFWFVFVGASVSIIISSLVNLCPIFRDRCLSCILRSCKC